METITDPTLPSNEMIHGHNLLDWHSDGSEHEISGGFIFRAYAPAEISCFDLGENLL